MLNLNGLKLENLPTCRSFRLLVPSEPIGGLFIKGRLMENIKKDTIAYKGNRKGYIFTCTYLFEPKGEALIEIEKDGKLIK